MTMMYTNYYIKHKMKKKLVPKKVPGEPEEKWKIVQPIQPCDDDDPSLVFVCMADRKK